MTSVLLRSVYGKTLWDQRRALVGWGIAFALLPLLLTSYWPSLEAQTEQIAALLESYPPAAKALFGIDDLTTAAGYLKAQAFSVTLPVLLLIYAISRGGDLLAGEEERGGLDVLLAHPVPRRDVVLQKAGALATGVAVLAAVAFASLALGTRLFGLDVALGNLAAATLLLALLALGFGMVGFAVGAARGRKGLALGVASGLAAAAFLLNSLAALVEGLRDVRWASPFAHYLATNPLREGLDAVAAFVLAAIPLAALALAVWGFERRDVGV